jgi:uridine kinase
MTEIQLENINKVIGEIKGISDGKAGNIIVAVSGGSATGKTSQVSKRINQELLESGYDSSILSQDSFQFGREYVDQFDDKEPAGAEEETRYKRIKKYKWDTPENFDFVTSLTALEKIKAGEKQITIPNFEVKEVKRVGTKTIEPTRITIFEGLYSFYDQLNDFPFDLRIYVDTPFYARLLRRYFRFVYEMKIPKPEKALKQICTTVLAAHQDFVETQKQNCHYCINIPYEFSKTIEILGLEPKSDKGWQNYEVIEQIEFESDGRAVIVKSSNDYHFIVEYKSKIWENLVISEELKEQVVSAWKSFV